MRSKWMGSRAERSAFTFSVELSLQRTFMARTTFPTFSPRSHVLPGQYSTSAEVFSGAEERVPGG
ncbi:uncharacterized protein LACBIDRAFT_302996 [Laccaria bicolor S238N-H82]|uniref:Predicted protein n=1 Tax=Laccaria bicolor (strain S238N-H82 / ATCC MYA-4686) TaxID=486041 RepID=B0DD83_LACBS|nr:uncharacterized protein LACBIDRAFT_298613 [Laccaria bicolor S238N-H82]XP_001890967.1 uncharacterized protein LACBIDRAFT_302996 [Laccaria bicolor S238N-H82]EDQ98379.1 predicted protein [Laccaria bicolor S238N-H82]EDR07434.1 predicted protein [Laccaria bicolor S238N-H82]|eukprot:XP_001881826.1 predicted protein [Laccaria bicolor S238N-H82]